MPIPRNKPIIFISYAHADEPEKPVEGEVKWLTFVRDHLRPAVKHGAVDIWVDTLMRGGDDWDPEIERKLRECDVFVLLVSRHSTSSDYVVDKEIAIIRERQKSREDVRFYPLLLTPTAEAGLDIVRDKNLRPRGARPFSSYSPHDRDQQMADAANEIAEIAEEIAARKSASSAEIAPTPAVSTQRESPPSPPAPSTLPPDPRMIGRADRLEQLVKAILDDDRPVVVPGALGMGKTTLALAAAYDSPVVGRFGKNRRFFVNLEPAPDAGGVLSRLALHLGLPASGAAPEVEATVAALCAAAPALAILDNLETPWRKDAAATEALLGRLAAIGGLRLVITVRGETPHIPGPGALTLQDLERLGDGEARALFLRHAGSQFAADPALPDLLRALDGHPLSIELLAANAAGKSNLKGLAADWSDRRADMLRRGAADNRMTSLRVSLDISLAALDPPSPAHRLIRLMALLPDGMAEADSRTALSDGGSTREERGAATRLEHARLAGRPDGRWRLLAPVRELLLADFPPEAQDRARLVKVFLRRAALGARAGTDKWAEVREELTAEAGNLDAMIGDRGGSQNFQEVSSCRIWALRVACLTGLASCASLQRPPHNYHDVGDVLGEANCIKSLGEIALRRSDHDGARQRYEAALPLYQKVGDVLGEANCVCAPRRHRPLTAPITTARASATRRRCRSTARSATCSARPIASAASATSPSPAPITTARASASRRRCRSTARSAPCSARPIASRASATSTRRTARSPRPASVGARRWRSTAGFPSPIPIGFTHLRLARRAATPDEAAEHREAARKAWESIGRPDLIEEHLGSSP